MMENVRLLIHIRHCSIKRFIDTLFYIYSILFPVFERIVRMCFAHLGKLLFVKLKPVDSLNMKLKNGEKCRKIGKLSSNSVMYRFRKWKKYNSLVKSYLNYLLLVIFCFILLYVFRVKKIMIIYYRYIIIFHSSSS